MLVLDHTGEPGGAELALVRVCAALGPQVDLRVLLFADGPLRPRLEDLGVVVEVLPLDAAVARLDRAGAGRLSLAQVGRVLRTLPFLLRLARRLRRLRPDVVHTTSLKADLLGTVAAGLAGRPLVWHVHDRISADYLPAVLVRLVRAAAWLPAALVTNSRATARTLPRGSTVVAPGFAPDQARARDAVAVRLDRLAGARGPGARGAARSPVVTLIGRVSPTKGQLELVRAAPAILARVPGARLRIVGSALFGAQGYAALVRAEADRLGVSPHLTWVDFTDGTAAELDGASVLVHASPVPEPFGQVIVEAMVRGVPVVATRGGGVTELLGGVEDAAGPDGRGGSGGPGRAGGSGRAGGPDGARGVQTAARGLLVPPGDPAALARAVLAVLDDPAAAAGRAQEAYDWAVETLPVAVTAQALTAVWGRVAARGRRPAP